MRLTIIEKKKGRCNFIGQIGKGEPRVAFFVHLDTVAPGDGWETDPFAPVVKNGKLYARGSVDSKGNFASSFAAVKKFLSLINTFRGTIFLIGTADEETGSEYGARSLLDSGFRVDYAIVPDGGSLDRIIIGEKGILRLKITSIGKQVHASHPDQGINAIGNLINFLQEINKDAFDDFSFNPAFDAVTINIGTIHGGHAANIVPAKAQAEIDIRFPLGITKTDILERISRIEKGVRVKKKNAVFTIEQSYASPAHLSDKNSPLITAFIDCAKGLGINMKIGTMGGNTDAKPLYLAGIETVVHDLGGSQTAHQANEFVEIESIRTAAALYASTLMKLMR
jgi:acetylornithine deacetylase/succinyl-diaminopimelate desuccinylase family protein